MTERLRDFVVEVPKELWQLNSNNLPHIPALMWDSEEHKRHQSSYRGPLGRLDCSSYGGQISLLFVAKLDQPDSPSISWRTTMDPLDSDRDVEDIRSAVIAEIFLEADPPVQLRYPQDSPLGLPGLTSASVPTSSRSPSRSPLSPGL